MGKGFQAFALAGAAALAGLAAIAVANEIDRMNRKRRLSDYHLEKEFSRQAREYMIKDMENLMIQFKRNFPGGSFEEFMMNAFPENVTVSEDGRSAKLDPRVMNADWQDKSHIWDSDVECRKELSTDLKTITATNALLAHKDTLIAMQACVIAAYLLDVASLQVRAAAAKDGMVRALTAHLQSDTHHLAENAAAALANLTHEMVASGEEVSGECVDTIETAALEARTFNELCMALGDGTGYRNTLRHICRCMANLCHLPGTKDVAKNQQIIPMLRKLAAQDHGMASSIERVILVLG